MGDLGEHLRRLRTKAGLTQAALAQAVGLSGNSLISRIESGRTNPTPRTVQALAAFFDHDVEALVAMASDARSRDTVLHLELEVMAQEAGRARTRLDASVESLLAEFEAHREVLTNFLLAAKLNLVWALPRKLKREGRASRIWVLSPRLDSETDVPEIRAMVKSNLARGASYRYLVRRRAPAIAKAQRLLTEFQGALAIRFAPDEVFDFAVETVIYDPGTEQRLSLMVAPTRRPEFDIVVGLHAADRFETAFTRWWRRSEPVHLQ